MNEALLKFLALGVIGLVVASALWLANSVPAQRAKPPFRTVPSAQFRPAADLQLAALPAQSAASAPRFRLVGVR